MKLIRTATELTFEPRSHHLRNFIKDGWKVVESNKLYVKIVK